MKLSKAIEIGHECGLERPEECVNNVLLHATMLFTYDEMENELAELIEDAKNSGIQFCPVCGAAMINGECYMKDLTHKGGEE